MQTRLPNELLATERGRRADAILRSCVHCGMCNAVCPTYQLLGDELDGPRGRIYLIKGMLEGAAETVSARAPELATARTHLDRCLTCRGCETACPSGVQYGELLEIGRELMEERKVARAPLDWVLRRFFGRLAPRPHRFVFWMRLGVLLRWMLPTALAKLIPNSGTQRIGPVLASALAKVWSKRKESPEDTEHAPSRDGHAAGAEVGGRETGEIAPAAPRALLLRGCVQRVATPSVNAAAARLLAANGMVPLWAEEEQCCGGLNLHLGQTTRAKQLMRQTIDALRPRLDEVDAIVSTASGCGVTVKDYGRLLADDPDYAVAAGEIAAKTRDIAEVAASFTNLAPPNDGAAADVARSSAFFARRSPGKTTRQKRRNRCVAWHAPCTLRHGQGVSGVVEQLLRRAGFDLLDVRDAHLCCGSAGIYSLLQRRMAGQLRDDKLANLMAGGPDIIVTANVGCQTHLAAAAPVPVVHWAELLAPPGTAAESG